jgi:hypothetical protein
MCCNMRYMPVHAYDSGFPSGLAVGPGGSGSGSGKVTGMYYDMHRQSYGAWNTGVLGIGNIGHRTLGLEIWHLRQAGCGFGLWALGFGKRALGFNPGGSAKKLHAHIPLGRTKFCQPGGATARRTGTGYGQG